MASILVVDDSDYFVKAVAGRLIEAGHSVETAKDGEEGLEKARKLSPGLIVLDIMLPKLNGFKLCQILKCDEEYGHIPIILVSSRSIQDDEEVFRDINADGFVSKIDTDMNKFFVELMKQVNKFLPKGEVS